MSIKVGILNDGTQLLADIKEVTDGDQTQYMVIKPFEVVYTDTMDMHEDGSETLSTTKKVGLKTWLEISDDQTFIINPNTCLLYTSPSPRDRQKSRMPSSA